MTTILLHHPAGPDRDALVSYLTKAPFRVTVLDSFDDLATTLSQRASPSKGEPVVIIQESLLPADQEPSAIVGLRTIVLGTRRTLPPRPGLVRMPDPCFLGQLKLEINRLVAEPLIRAGVGAMTGDSPAPREPSGSVPRVTDLPDSGPLLRGIAHALANPLSAAMGWLQLLDIDLGEDDPRQRALRQARNELGRLEKLIQALSHVGQRPGGVKAPLDLESLLRDRVRELEHEGLAVRFECEAGPLPRVLGDPAAFGLMADLLLGSFLEERSKVGEISVILRRSGACLELRLAESQGSLPPDLDPGNLGLLLKQVRYSRAIGIALATALARARPGGDVCIEPVPSGGFSSSPGAPVLVMRIPAAASAVEEQQ